MVTPRITATQLYDQLLCRHRVAMDLRGDPARREPASPFTQLLWERGVAHERDVMSGCGRPFLDLTALAGDAREAATREALARREPLIYGGRLSVHELLGEPDLLRLEGGAYVAIDIKSGAALEGAALGGAGDEDEVAGKPKRPYGVQLALYTDLLERLGLSAGRYAFIWDGNRNEVRYDLAAKLGPRTDSLWGIYLKARAQLLETLADPAASRGALCSHCKQCVWRSACLESLQRARDLTLIPELGASRRDALAGEYPSLDALAAADVEAHIHNGRTSFAGVGARSLRRYQRLARLLTTPGATPALLAPVDWPPQPAQLFFDIEADPLRDLCYLHGFLSRDAQGNEHFEAFFAAQPTPAAERDAFAQAMNYLRTHADWLVVHYSSYERTAYRKLARRHPGIASEAEIEALFTAPRALDLYLDVVKTRSEWPVNDLSIKTLAKHCGFAWRDVDPGGAASIEWFERWARTGDPALRQRLLDYNEDDCRAMRVVMDAMRGFAVRPAAD